MCLTSLCKTFGQAVCVNLMLVDCSHISILLMVLCRVNDGKRVNVNGIFLDWCTLRVSVFLVIVLSK